MRRIIDYSIPDTSSGTTIKYFLLSRGYTTGSLTQLKQYPQGILLNNSPATVNQVLQCGDLLTIQIIEDTSSEKITPIELPLDIVYEDEDILLVNKPSGMPIHPSVNNYDTSVANALAWHFKKLDTSFIFRCINRLDKDTSGLTLIAKHFVSAGILSNMVAQKSSQPSNTIRREYLAIVRGLPNPPSGTINAPIGRKPGSILERMIDYENGESAITHYKLLKEANGHSLLSLQLETGRTHQIRIHMKHIGFPLIGDYLYNPDRELIQRQALHSHKLQFSHPITGEAMEFIAPLPKDMQNVLLP